MKNNKNHYFHDLLTRFFAISIIVFSLTVFVTGSFYFYNELIREKQRSGLALLNSLDDKARFALLLQAPENMENAIESAFSYPGVSRIVVFDDKLNIFSERKTNEYQQKYSLPFEGEEFPVISPLFSSYIVIFSPIYNTENVLEYSIGYCLIEFDKTLLVYSIARFVFIFALVIASVGILMWSFVLRYTRRFTSSLNSLSEHMAILSHYEPSSNATKEIADIEQTYLRMMKNIEERDLQIKSYIQELNDSNLNAKKQVIERTIELQKARDDAVSANMKKNEFLATISHEFRTPLQAIIGYTDLLEPATRNLSNLEDLSNIKTAAFDLMAMVNEILEFQRNEKGRFNLQPTTFSLERLRSEVVGILSPLSRINHNQLIVNIDGQTIEWHTDYFKLKQIITSLGSNACKFTNGGVIRISFNSAFTPSPILCIEITDTGIGISEDNLDAIFQPFKKIRTDNQLIEGTGLGLAVAKQFVEHLQGSILVESQINKGTQFLVEIPMFSDSEAIISKAKIRTPHSNKNELMNQSSRLLFLDDDPVILNILSRFVEGYGMTVDTANLLRDAEYLVTHNKYDLLIIDYNLTPTLNGIEAARRLSELYNADIKLKIAILTADVTDETAKLIHSSDYLLLHKPITKQSLKQALAAFLKPTQLISTIN